MKDYNEEYFFMGAGGINFPAFTFIGEKQTSNMHKFFKDDAIDDKTVISLGFDDPKPRKPQMADGHSMASNRVISKRIKELLESLQLKHVQFIPAIVYDKDEKPIEGYYIPHIYNLIRCVDTEKSIYTDNNEEDPDNPIYDIEKLVLDNKILDQIPLEERLIFGLFEDNLTRVYHRSVAEKILALKPEGITFYQLSTYDPSQPFQTAWLDYLLNGED